MIKQTQTKMFDFSDVGLDFCTGSKNKFPEVFKKMLATGFNPKTVNSVSISGSTITLTYGVTHGYVADRVLQVTASGGFDKQVYIDSVTTNTVTCTVLDGITTGLTGTITTKVASLGWDIVYEVGNIHVYKMKHIDDTDRYVRFCFENNASYRNCVAVCIGKTADLTTGVIDDPNSLASTRSITSPGVANIPRWDTYTPTSSHNNWTYSQGFSTYGKGVCVGSLYHFAFLSGDGYASAPHHIYGIFPAVCHAYEALDYPVLVGVVSATNGNATGGHLGNFCYGSTSNGFAALGGIRVRFDSVQTVTNTLLSESGAVMPTASTLSATLDAFNTTTAKQLEIYEHSTSQHLGYCYGLFLCMYSNTNTPSISISNSPHVTTDIDFNNLIVVAASAANTNAAAYTRFIAVPVEEIKYGI